MNNKIRYAIVGLGHIAQTAVLPAFEHAENSELAALVTGNSEKDRELSERYIALERTPMTIWKTRSLRSISMPFTSPRLTRFTANTPNVLRARALTCFAKNQWPPLKKIVKR